MLQCNSMKLTTCKKTLLSFMLVIIASLSTYAQQTLWVGQSYTFDVSSSVMGITANMSWSTNGGYLSLSGSGFYRTITVTQYFSGTATVTCEWDYRLTGSGSYTHTKRQVTISCRDNQVSISPTSMTMSPGETRYVSYRHQYDNQYTSAANAYFQSSDPSICTVSPSGEVTAKKPGTAYINVYSKISSGAPYCTVTVKETPVESATIPSSINTVVGEDKKFYVSISPSNATINQISWHSEDPTVATISSSGVLTGINPGTTTVYCLVNNSVKSNNAIVNVDKATLSLSVTPDDCLIQKGTEISLMPNNLNAQIYYTLDGSNPTKRSAQYYNPIKIERSCTLRAFATLNNYYDSSVLSQEYEVTSLDITDFSPSDNETNVSPAFIPVITYNSDIVKGVPFSDITFENVNSHNIIECDILINQNKIQFIPDNYLVEGEYLIRIPERAVFNKNSESNLAFSYNFSVKNKVEAPVLEMGANHMLLENGSLYMWGSIDDYPRDVNITTPWTSIKISENVTSAKLSSYQKYFIKNDNSLWGWNTRANEDCGYLGNGDYGIHSNPVKIASDIKSIVYGESHFGAISQDDILYLWGRNDWGQIGNGTTTTALSPKNIMSDVVKCCIGTVETIALKKDGTLWAWGRSYIINGKREKKMKPVKIMSGVTDIAIGYLHVLALKDDNSLWGFGYNDSGQIGNGSYSSTYCTTPIKIMDNVKNFAADFDTSIALTNDEKLYRWGGFLHSSKYDRAAPLLILENVKDFKVTGSNIIAKKNDLSLWICGNNYDGTLGNGSFGGFSEYATEFYSPISDVAKYWAGNSKIFVLKNDNSLWGFGRGLGTGTYDGSPTPIELIPASKYTTCENVSLASFLSLPVGAKSLLELILTPLDADYDSVEWNSEDERIVSINQRGVAYGVSAGTTTVKASVKCKDRTFDLTCKVTVTDQASIEDIIQDCKVIQINHDGNTLKVSNLSEGSSISICSLTGAVLYSDIVRSDQFTWQIPYPGLFIIISGNEVRKIIAK